MKLAIISDLHIGEAARAKDFSTDPSTRATLDNYIGSFKNKFGCQEYKCDALFIAGDITNRAMKKEFDLAAKRISDIAEILKVPSERIYFTPGNHDSNWAIGKVIAEQGVSCANKIRRERYKLFNEDTFISQRLAQAKFGSFSEHPYSVIWDDDDIFVFSFNSSANDSHESSIHHGAIETEDYKAIKNILDACKCRMDGKIKVLLTHHHPINYHERTYSIPDYSVMKNSEIIIQIAEEYYFDFVIHGHKHIPRYKHIVSNAQHPFNLICSGSFSSVLDRHYFDGVGNSFHIVDIHEICNINDIPKGVLRSWSYYYPHGWMDKAIESQMDHLEPFGTNKSRREVKRTVRTAMEQLFLKGDIVKLSRIMDLESSLKFYSRTALNIVIAELSSEIGFTIYRNDGDALFLRTGV